MAKAIYVGVSGVARKVKQPFIGVSNVARKVKDGYIGVSGVARQFLSAGTPLSSYSEGSIVKLNESGSPVEFYVAQHNYNNAGIALFRKELHPTKHIWSSSDHPGGAIPYSISDIDSWLNNEYFNTLDSSIQAIIPSVNIYVTKLNDLNGYSSFSYATLTQISRKVFLPSMYELNFTQSDFRNFNGFLCKNEGSPFPNYDNMRLPNNYWFRSVAYSYDDETDDYTYMGPALKNKLTGNIMTGSPSKNTLGVRPVIVLPTETLVNPTTNIVLG